MSVIYASSEGGVVVTSGGLVLTERDQGWWNAASVFHRSAVNISLYRVNQLLEQAAEREARALWLARRWLLSTLNYRTVVCTEQEWLDRERSRAEERERTGGPACTLQVEPTGASR